MRINFENEGKGTANLTNVNYTLRERGTNNSLTSFTPLLDKREYVGLNISIISLVDARTITI
jgi:hypothetical protein